MQLHRTECQLIGRSLTGVIFVRCVNTMPKCVRLDQKSSIHAKAEEEYKQIVCFGGRLLDTICSSFKFLKAGTFGLARARPRLCFPRLPIASVPVARYLQSGRCELLLARVYCSCRVEINQTKLVLESLGSIRINEGWLERRLRNVEERKAFFDFAECPPRASHWMLVTLKAVGAMLHILSHTTT